MFYARQTYSLRPDANKCPYTYGNRVKNGFHRHFLNSNGMSCAFDLPKKRLWLSICSRRFVMKRRTEDEASTRATQFRLPLSGAETKR